MAGHSQFANIKHRKGAQDKKRANLFTKLVREIIVSAKSGLPDPAHNPRLRLACAAARAKSMPKDRIEGAIKKATSAGEGDDYIEIRYEGYAPAGIALIVETMTDNRNRTAGDVRSTLAKHGGNLGESGSVSFNFERVGYIQYKKEIGSEEVVFEAALEAGATDCVTTDSTHEIYCEADSFAEVQKAIAAKFGDPDEGRLDWRANAPIELDLDSAQKVENLIEKLEDLDDVQRVYSNHTYSEEVANKLV